MQHLTYLIAVLFLGFGLATIVDITGSILSRRLNFKYGYFGILSLVAYTTVAFLVAEKTNSALVTMIVVMLVGLYDAIIGSKIAERLNANHGYSKEMMEKITIAHRIFAGNLYAIISGILGYYLASR